MVLDSKLQKIRDHFGITKLTDWSGVRPEWILSIPGIGPVTLDHVRLYLACRDTALEDDKTPEFWRNRLGSERAVQLMSYEETSVILPFTIIVDSMEQHPWTFSGIRPDKNQIPLDLAKLVREGLVNGEDICYQVPQKRSAIGVGKGDYTIANTEGIVHIERKSMEDAHSTILGWGERRERFIRELEFLACVDTSAVIVECGMGEMLSCAPQWGRRSAEENRKILFRQVLAWQQDYRVPWLFCESRRMAEIACFRLLMRAWSNCVSKRKENAKYL